jgi:hypothetical protein
VKARVEKEEMRREEESLLNKRDDNTVGFGPLLYLYICSFSNPTALDLASIDTKPS